MDQVGGEVEEEAKEVEEVAAEDVAAVLNCLPGEQRPLGQCTATVLSPRLRVSQSGEFNAPAAPRRGCARGRACDHSSASDGQPARTSRALRVTAYRARMWELRRTRARRETSVRAVAPCAAPLQAVLSKQLSSRSGRTHRETRSTAKEGAALQVQILVFWSDFGCNLRRQVSLWRHVVLLFLPSGSVPQE